ncbi:MAG: hypothetical protein MMC23_004163 [Stictis urceolatum]|nr:hypothetical protein [Stictis urceolata]
MEDYDFPTDPIARKDAIVEGEQYRFTILKDGLVRCEWAEDGQFEDRASTFAINRSFDCPQYRLAETDDTIDITTDRFQLTYDKKRFSASGLTVNVLGKVVQWGGRWRYGDYSSSLGGTARTLDNVDGRCELGPGVISRVGFSAIDDHDTMLFDNGWVSGRKDGGREDIYVFAFGHDYKAAINAYYEVSGKQPIVPRWALGNWWSRYYPYSADEYLALMDKFKEKKVPLSVAVLDMDWHLVDDPNVAHSGWTGYTWNKKLFPEPQAFLDELHKRNLKVCPNDHPAEGVWSHEAAYEEMAKEIGHDTTNKAPIQFDATSPKFMKAYLKMFSNLGMDFNWVDWQQGPHSRVPGVDPLWVLNHFHFLENARKGGKPMIFSRYGGPGSHRYPVGFSGDTIVTWNSLHFQPEFTATASNIGYGWWSHDIGGHMEGFRDDEMATRWIQLGVFSPIMRLHSVISKWTSKEPWEYTKEAEEAMSSILCFRHRMIPYLYTMDVLGSRKNRPLVQPLYWEFPDRSEAYDYPNEFYFGTQLLIAPITSPRNPATGFGSVKAWLPPTPAGKRWIDIFTGTVYDSDRTISLFRPLNQYPVLAPEGSIIPLEGGQVSNGGRNPDTVEVLVIIGADARFDMIEDAEDDGEQAEKGTSGERVTTLAWDQMNSTFTISPSKEAGDSSVKRTWILRFISAWFEPEAKANVEGKPVKSGIAIDRVKSSGAPSTVIPIRPGPINSEVTVHLSRVPEPKALNFKDNLHVILKRYQVAFKLKDQVWDIATADGIPPSIKASQLLELDADKAVLGPILELLLADSRDSV